MSRPSQWDRLRSIAGFIDRTRALRNPGSVVAAQMGRSTTLRFRSGLDVRVGPGTGEMSWATARALLSFAFCGIDLVGSSPTEQQWAVDQRAGTLTTHQGLRLTLDSVEPTIFVETFIQQIHYAQADMRGLTVVDAGAFVGDTALYFANLGAEVYSYEPDPGNFRKLQRNLALNPCGTRVHPFQKAVGIDGDIPFRFGDQGGSQGYQDRGIANATVESVSLDTITAPLPEDPFLLKADIKGAEYEVVGQAGIRRFRKLAIEYSRRAGYGLPYLLTKLREQGFEGVVCNPYKARAPISAFGMLRMDRVR